MQTGIEGRVAVVTGAASGIGRATAQALAAEGALLVAADLRDDACAELVAQRPAACVGCAADVRDPDGARRPVAAALERFGRVDILVACAGVYETTPAGELTDDEWERVLAINLRGTFLTARAAIEAMQPNGWGRVITFGSIAAATGGSPAGPAYVASKAGVIGVTRSLARFAGPHGVTVNCIVPGVIETPMTSVIDAEARRATAARTPLGRNGTPEEVAAVAVMLASEGASFVHGAHVAVTGGVVMD